MSTLNAHLCYSLAQAFDLTGQTLFQHEWNGHEAFAARADDPAPLLERREQIEDRLTDLGRQRRALRYGLEDVVSQTERDEISQEFAAITDETKALNEELNCLPEHDSYMLRDFEAYQRRMEVERLLRDAFKHEELRIHLLTGFDAKYREWITERHFYISFPQSLVLPPRSSAYPRRCPAYVNRDAFDGWMARFAKDAVTAGELTDEEKCRLWLLGEISKPKGQRIKADYLHEALILFPGLSQRAFERVWANHAPAEWKRPIRRSTHRTD